MEKIIDKLIIFICCGILLLSENTGAYIAVPFIVVVAEASLNIAFDIPVVHIGLYLAHLLACCFMPQLIYFIPLMCYDLFFAPYKYVSAVALLLIYIRFEDTGLLLLVWMAALVFLTYLLKKRTAALLSVRQDSYMMRDELNEQSDRLRSRNRELLEKQDYEISNATLNERNRIAREIHDTVGHIISSSILQIGALMAVTENDEQREYLAQIKDTLSSGMDSIRASIHNIHENSMDLEPKLAEIVKNFTFCEVSLNYKISTDFSMKAKYSLIFIVREALSNVMKHSNATRVEIIFSELPGLYQIIIADNGTAFKRADNRQHGMGVSGMCDRVNGLNGNISISTDNGYRIFITLPKE